MGLRSPGLKLVFEKSGVGMSCLTNDVVYNCERIIYLHMYITFSYRMKLVCVILCIFLVTGCYGNTSCRVFKQEVQNYKDF